MEKIVELRNVSMFFRSRSGLLKSIVVKAVDGVSLYVGKAETLALVGESGSGKTTVAKLSLRLLKPTGGRIIFEGVDITYTPEKELRWFRRKAQAVFQDPYSSINPYMTIRQIVEEPLILHKVEGDKVGIVEEALEAVRLIPAEEYLDKYPHMHSGGQRQRVGIARALVLKPIYIAADEPVSMIDASSRAEILYLLRELQEKRGISFLYITHDMATARHFSDRIAVMHLGKIVEIAESNDIVNNPLHPYTQALIEAVPDPNPANRFRERKTVSGEPLNPANPPEGCRFHPRCPYVMDICRLNDPELKEIKKGHYVACHLY
ncbi:MAG TPA: ABC transporter ATP-binding protein [Candidatus Caldiarchaeum subterraneum]|uniref:ABC transporter ATP-binding protein n=1 Tax=Caldiarchaeum subterraneum TaxID=311458 RepID=A0A833E9I9_CALS0|nr:ABC transporter ATP-binding protein [Candidatus Caldarchaeum subterraneum]